MDTSDDKVRDAATDVINYVRDGFELYSRMALDPAYAGGFQVTIGPYKWQLKNDCQLFLDRLTPRIDALEQTIRACETAAPADSAMLKSLQQARAMLVPGTRSHHKEISAYHDDFVEHIENIRDHVTQLADERPGITMLVVDTNSLLWNTNLEGWRFDGIDEFTIVLFPKVIGEIDNLKNRKTGPESRRRKAKTIVRKIKEYRRRGKITEGVTLVKNKIHILGVAIEPDFERTLPWLKESSSDDQIIACAIEVIRAHPKCAIAIVTRDLVMQIKAEFAQIDDLDPPNPPAKPTKTVADVPASKPE